MSVDHVVYVGVYLRVYMPKIQIPSGAGKCPVCSHMFGGDKFCRNDGAELIHQTEWVMKDMGEFMLAHLGDEDKFTVENNYTRKDFCLVMGNQPGQPGYVYVRDDEGEQEIPRDDLSGGWQELMNELGKEGIRYTTHFGIVSYWI